MDWEIEYSDGSPGGPFAPVARVSAETWWDAERALFEVTDGVLGFGFYRVRAQDISAPRLYHWTGEECFRLVPEMGVTGLEPVTSSLSSWRSPN
jgi:hypothetical protein